MLIVMKLLLSVSVLLFTHFCNKYGCTNIFKISAAIVQSHLY